jgi:hypothetical protein
MLLEFDNKIRAKPRMRGGNVMKRLENVTEVWPAHDLFADIRKIK